MKIIGLPDDIIKLVKVWLKDRFYYVDLNGNNSYLFDLLLGTVQGSVLGPVLYAIYVSPLFDIAPLLSFADDSYDVQSNKDKSLLIKDVEKSLETITKWLKKSGLKVNQDKTDLCLFYKHDTAPIKIKIGDSILQTKNEINVLGVLFDSKLKWSNHVSKVITKANKALNAIKLIRRYFNSTELLQLLTSNFFSVLYYNLEVWHLSSLKCCIKNDLLSASANAIRVALHYPDPYIGFQDLHRMTKRATPDMFCIYKLCILLYKTFNEQLPENEWIEMNFNQITMTRQTDFKIMKTNRLRVGMNILNNRFHVLNGLIPLDWLNRGFQSFKILCKNKFLTFVG